MEQTRYLLEMRNVHKSFPGVKALDGVTIKVRPGTVHTLMGENGAGKSTLMKCLFGIYKMDEGEVFLDGQQVEFVDSKNALENGVAMVHQELNQALHRSVMENMWLGRYPSIGPFIKEKEMYDKTKEILGNLDIEVDPKRRMSTMSVSLRQMVEIGKAVSYNSKIIVFDEPTSSLNAQEVEHLFRIINDLRSKGCGIIYISHKMEEILRISDDITIMRDGQYICTEPVENMNMDKIIKLMVGRELTQRFPPKENKPGEVILRCEGMTGRYNHLQDVSFELKRGEILGVAGLDGSGRTELLETLYGYATRKEGKIFLHDKEIFNRSPEEAVKNKFALVTEERRATGIFGILNVRENALISHLSDCKKSLLLDHRKMVKKADWVVKSLKVKTPSQDTKIRSLSGGNQQKVIFGRWMLTEPEVFLLDEPTRGIDVGAKYEIYQLMVNLAKEGKGIIMVSSEMPELLGMADRILVMSGGQVAGILETKNINQEDIMRLAAKFA